MNTNHVVSDTGALTKSVANGQRFEISGNGLISPPLLVAHVYETNYLMGKAYGELFIDLLPKMINETYQYFDDQIEQYLLMLDFVLDPRS